MLKLLMPLLVFFFITSLHAQTIDKENILRIEKILTADDLQGRKVFTPGIEKAAEFVEMEFKAAGLQPWKVDSGFRQEFTIDRRGRPMEGKLTNVIGILPGKSKPNEYVIFSAHYDHLGVGKANAAGDSIFNGANDDASGTTAIIALANYFAKRNNNQRTLLFVAFTAEESGGYGSTHFSRQLDPEKVVAMFNIEMIGTESKWGTNSAYITGYDKTDMGKILEKNLAGSSFKFYPDPYPEQGLFYRSDNATLARLGVPAHTIATAKMDAEPHYHSVSDEVSTLDIDNMTAIIQAIALSSESIVKGEDTPSRIPQKKLP